MLFFPAYALAELVDNCLSATSLNSGMRTIEIRMVGYAVLLTFKHFFCKLLFFLIFISGISMANYYSYVCLPAV